MNDTNDHRGAPLIFLKAVVKKQVWIPGYTKRNGTVVAGAYKMVNVSADHDEHKVVSGQGNYTQQQAHKKLAKKKWFGELPHDHKVAHVLHEATKIQDEAGENARLSTLQKNLLAGKSPIPAEWKAFHNAPQAKRDKVIAAMHTAGKGEALLDGYTAWQKGNAAAAEPAQPEPKAEEKNPEPEAKPEPAPEVKPTPSWLNPTKPSEATTAHLAAESKKLAEAKQKPEPKAAPAPISTDAHPTEKVAHVLAQIEAAKGKLPEGHHLKAGQVKKLDAIAQALQHGDEKSILMHAYHTHTYGKQAAKLANAALDALGSKHTVTVGQKMAEHPALKDEPAKQSETAAAPAEQGPKDGDTKDGADGTLVFKDGHWHKKEEPKAKEPAYPGASGSLHADIAGAFEVGDMQTLKDIHAYAKKEGFEPAEQYAAKKIAELEHANADSWAQPAHAETKTAEPAADALAMPDFSSGKNENPKVVEYYQKVAQKVIDHAKAGNASVLEDLKESGLKPNSNGKVGNTWKGKTANSKALLALYDAALAHAKGNAPAAAAETAATAPAAPHGVAHPEVSAPYQQALNQVDEWVNKAKMQDLEKMATMVGVGGDLAKLKGYAAELFEKITGEKPDYNHAHGVTDKPKYESTSDAMGDHPEGISDAYYKTVDGFVIDGDKAGLIEYAGALTDNKPDVAKWAYALAATMPDAPRDAAEPAAAAAAPAPAKIPVGVNKELARDALAAAGKGDIQTLKDIHVYAKEQGLGKTADFVQALMPAGAAKPVKPEVTGMVANSIADQIGNAIDKGDAAHLKAQLFQIGNPDANSNFAKLKAYAEAGLAHVQGTGAAADNGPKDGDTKQGADGMLVFKDGRWHKQGGEQAAATGPSAAEAVKKLKLGKMTGKNSVKLKKKIEQLKEIAIKGGAAELDKAVQITPTGAVKVMGLSVALSEGSTQYGPSIPEFVKYVKALHEAVVGAGAVGGEKAAPTSYAIPPKPQKVVGAAAPTATESIEGWKQVGPQGGYNPGGTFEDTNGQQWYVKFPAGGEKIAKNELLATKLYAAAGVAVPEVKLINQGGKIGLASKIVAGAVADKSKLLEGKAPGLLQGFGADAWLANWDTVGNNPAAGKGFDNILFAPDGSAIRIDAGGALLYGGAGGKKQKFENEVTDLQTMLDPAKNKNTAAVFGKMSAADIAASVAKVAAIPDHEIEGLVMEFGPGSDSEKTRLAEKLIARKQYMIQQYPSAVKSKAGEPAPKAKPNPSALPVDASLLPAPHDFMNWQGTGKPISEKPYVKGNIADEQEILNIALQGDLTALKGYKFQPVDKLTGAPVGEKKSIEEHPSKYVQQYYDTIVSYLDMLANPPEPLRIHTPKKASSLSSLSAAFKPHDFGMTTEKAAKNAQIGFWIALGVADEPGKFAKAAKKISSAAIQKAKDVHAKLPASVRTFISGVQGSGSYNNPYRDGKETDHSGAKTRAVLTDLYNHASTQEAGTTIHKWMSIAPETVKQFMDAPDGLVFQNPGSMCTSYDPTATKHFGKDRVTIRYAEGAKALNSFASGSFASEMEITTLPGARFMVLSRKMVADEEHGKPNEKRFELELLMLPPDPTYVDNLLKKA